MRQLRDIREWRERLGMGTAGGLCAWRAHRKTQDAESGGDEDA